MIITPLRQELENLKHQQELERTAHKGFLRMLSMTIVAIVVSIVSVIIALLRRA